jgi:hypothetical protein
MIDRAELELLVHGATGQAGHAVEGVAGTRLTRSELDALAVVFLRFGSMVADRCTLARVPPPPPAPRPQARAQFFNPLQTTELRRVGAEDIERATKK